jgi:nicotinamidase-related amidase
MTAARRIEVGLCCGVLIDVQKFFLAQLDKRHRARIVTNTANFVRLLDHFRIPLVVTLEIPLDRKGVLPPDIERRLGKRTAVFEKNFFDLGREKKIVAHLGRLKKKQAIVAGCETDVCVLQSCLGLIDLGYEVYVVEELVFSSSRYVEAAMARMRSAGATFVSYKTLYYELLESVDGSRHTGENLAALGPTAADLPDTAV